MSVLLELMVVDISRQLVQRWFHKFEIKLAYYTENSLIIADKINLDLNVYVLNLYQLICKYNIIIIISLFYMLVYTLKSPGKSK